jgi:hypothetical protein
MSVQELSIFKSEQEILLLPYIIFKISSINKDVSQRKCLIELDELENSELISKILEHKVYGVLGGYYIPKSYAISAVNENMIKISSDLNTMENNLYENKNEFNQIMIKMIKDNNLDSENE